MRNINRIEPFLKNVKKLWLQNPDLRFGQIMYIIINETEKDVFYIEDKEMTELINNIIEANN